MYTLGIGMLVVGLLGACGAPATVPSARFNLGVPVQTLVVDPAVDALAPREKPRERGK